MDEQKIINQINRIYKLVKGIDTDWKYAQSVGAEQKEEALKEITKLRNIASLNLS